MQRANPTITPLTKFLHAISVPQRPENRPGRHPDRHSGHTRADPDLWGHVLFGQEILGNGRIPTADSFSFPVGSTVDQPRVALGMRHVPRMRQATASAS